MAFPVICRNCGREAYEHALITPFGFHKPSADGSYVIDMRYGFCPEQVFAANMFEPETHPALVSLIGWPAVSAGRTRAGEMRRYMRDAAF